MTTIHIPVPPDRCDTCGAEYENIGHPLKPGVVIMRRCKCEVVTQTHEYGTVTMLVPPKT
jgi:hypothetical protein